MWLELVSAIFEFINDNIKNNSKHLLRLCGVFRSRLVDRGMSSSIQYLYLELYTVKISHKMYKYLNLL